MKSCRIGVTPTGALGLGNWDSEPGFSLKTINATKIRTFLPFMSLLLPYIMELTAPKTYML